MTTSGPSTPRTIADLEVSLLAVLGSAPAGKAVEKVRINPRAIATGDLELTNLTRKLYPFSALYRMRHPFF
jgi:hypothetical protein